MMTLDPIPILRYEEGDTIRNCVQLTYARVLAR